MGRRMTLKGQISLCLAAFFLALAGQIFLSFYQSGTVLRELDNQMGNFNAISRFQNGVERSLSAMEDYRWEYGDAKALTEELHSAFSVTNAWLWRIESDLGTVSEEQYLLYNAVSTTYDSYTALVDQLEEAVAAGQDTKAAQLYYNKIVPCGGYLRQYTQQLLNTAITDAQGTYTTVSALSDRVKWVQTVVVALCLALAANMLVLADKGTPAECRAMAETAIADGSAFAKCKEMFAAQGGDTRVLDDYSLFEQPAASFELLAEQDGYIVANDAEKIGSASVLLGAGRQKKGDPLDFAAGITLHKKRGDYVKKGESLATFYGAADKFEAAAAEYRSGLGYGPEKPEEAPLVYALVTKDGVARY